MGREVEDKNSYFGLSGVRALPLGVHRQNVVAIVLAIISISLFLSEVLTFLPEWAGI